MSADNWAICPKCFPDEDAVDRRLLENDLREDYEIGIYKGKFFIRYHGKCSVCGFTKVFKHEEMIT